MPTVIEPSSRLLRPPASDLVLRVHRSSSNQDTQPLRLSAAKCTIGADPTCTIAMDYAVHPVHCLILRGRQGAIVRRWSPDTLLNGAAFNDAPLHNGDQLRIGNDVVEIVDLGIGSSVNHAASSGAPTAASENAASENAAIAHLRSARDSARRRMRLLLAQLRQTTTNAQEQQAIAERANHANNASQKKNQQLEETLQQQDQDLAECRNQLSTLQEELQRKHEVWSVAREEIQTTQVDWERVCKENAGLREEIERVRQSQQLKVDEVLQSQQALLSELEAVQFDVKAAKEQAQLSRQEQESLQAECEDLRQQCDKARRETKTEQAKSERLADEAALLLLEQADSDADATADATADAKQNDCIAEVSLGGLEDAPTADAADQAPHDLSAANSCTTNDGNTGGNDETNGNDEDESIEAYMARLLQRVQEEKNITEDEPSHAAPREQLLHREEPLSDAADLPCEQEAPYDAWENPACEMEPRSQPPEQSHHLAAMRDLANTTARQAISKYARQVAVAEVSGKFALAATAATCTAYLGFFGTGNSSLHYAGAVVTGVVAVVWGRQIFSLIWGQRPSAEQQTNGSQKNAQPETDGPKKE